MKHVFGMAKSSLDFKGAKAPKLELDFLRLAYVVANYRRAGEEAQGYLLVLGPEIQARVGIWIAKYGASDSVACISHTITDSERKGLALEKVSNVAGMVAGAQGKEPGRQSDATLGHELGERALRAAILAAEPLVNDLTSAGDLPLGIRWDFYGVVPRSAPSVV